MQAGFATDAGDAENDSNPWWGPSGTSLDRNGLDVASDLYVPEAGRLSPQDLDLARILRWRGQPYAVGNDGALHFFDIDRGTGYPLSKPGSEISTNMRSDGVTVRQHLFTDANGEVIVLGTDYGVPPQYATGQPANVGGDPVASLRRQVAVSADHAELGRQYIDAGSGQVDPARWDEFLQAAQQAGLRMTVTSNGIQNPYYQGMDNARIIAGGYENSLTINVYNPTTGSTFLDAGIEAGAAVMFNRTQSAQVAIRNQMGEALELCRTKLAHRCAGLFGAVFRSGAVSSVTPEPVFSVASRLLRSSSA